MTSRALIDGEAVVCNVLGLSPDMPRAWGVSSFLGWWLQALGLALVLMPLDEAVALIASSEGEELESAHHRPYPNRRRQHPLVVETTMAMTWSFKG